MAQPSYQESLTHNQGHILIGGTGRSGTTLLVQILTQLGFDTGFSQDAASRLDPISKAGLEHRLVGDGLPQVIKSPWLADDLELALAQGVQVEAAIVPMRDLYQAAESRRQVFRRAQELGKDPLAHPGSLWQTSRPQDQEAVLAGKLHKFLEALARAEVPVMFLSFPRLVRDGEYFYRQLEPLFTRHGVGREAVLAAHRRLAEPGLVSSFPAARPDPRPARDAGQARLGDFISPASFWRPAYLCDSAWTGHAPLAFWLMEAARPQVLVELGSWRGYSFFAFCQAVRIMGLATQCHAVDTWQGFPQADYGEEIFQAASEEHRHYQDFARLLRMTFDEALPLFPDGSVDLLHIDGLHDYEAVLHDYTTWLPKLSPRGVVLFHDTADKDMGFGVYRLWDELKARHPHFEFFHSHGLGLLAPGEQAPAKVLELCGASADPGLSQEIRAAYEQLGASLSAELEARKEQERLEADAGYQRLLRYRRLKGVTRQRLTHPGQSLRNGLRRLSGKSDS